MSIKQTFINEESERASKRERERERERRDAHKEMTKTRFDIKCCSFC